MADKVAVIAWLRKYAGTYTIPGVDNNTLANWLAATPAAPKVAVTPWKKKGHGGEQQKATVSMTIGDLTFYPMKDGSYASPCDYSLERAEAWAAKLRAALAATPAAPQGYVAVEIYAAWRMVGADVAGLKWDDFVEALRKGKESSE